MAPTSPCPICSSGWRRTSATSSHGSSACRRIASGNVKPCGASSTRSSCFGRRSSASSKNTSRASRSRLGRGRRPLRRRSAHPLRFPDVADDRDEERRIATVAARLLGWSNALATGSGGDASAAVQELRATASVPTTARAVVFAGACARAGDREFVEALLESHPPLSLISRRPIRSCARRSRHGSASRSPRSGTSTRLVPHETETRDGYAVWKGRAAARRRRDGFALTDDATRCGNPLRDRSLHLLPRPRHGLVLEGHAQPQGRDATRSIRSASRSRAARSKRRSPRCTSSSGRATTSARSR